MVERTFKKYVRGYPLFEIDIWHCAQCHSLILPNSMRGGRFGIVHNANSLMLAVSMRVGTFGIVDNANPLMLAVSMRVGTFGIEDNDDCAFPLTPQ